MPRSEWEQLLAWAINDGSAIANSTTETILMPDVSIQAGYLNKGRTLRLKMQGKLSTTGTPTIQFRVRWGGVAGTLIAQSELITCGSGVTDVLWELEVIIQQRVDGATGTVVAIGNVFVVNASQEHNMMSVGGEDTPAATTVDLTAETDLSVTAEWGTQSASNTITAMNYFVESMN